MCKKIIFYSKHHNVEPSGSVGAIKKLSLVILFDILC